MSCVVKVYVFVCFVALIFIGDIFISVLSKPRNPLKCWSFSQRNEKKKKKPSAKKK